MESKQFTTEEIEQIKKLQEKYSVLGLELVQLKLAKSNAESYVKALAVQESLIEEQIQKTNDEEKNLAKVLDDKYGAGSLDMKTGEFIPNK